MPVSRNINCIHDDFLVSSTDHTELFVYVNNYSSLSKREMVTEFYNRVGYKKNQRS